MTRLLWVQRDRLRFPLDEATAVKWDALSAAFDVRVVAGEAEGAPDPRFVPAGGRGGAAFYATLPGRLVRELRRFRPDVAIAQTPYEGAALLAARAVARVPARVVVDVHGDWRWSTRGYGSRLRRLLAPAGDRLAVWAIRHADGVRTISPFTSDLVRALGREPDAEFPTFADLRAFAGPPAPLPERPTALYVGVLEATKNVHVLAAAWREAAPRLQEARLVVVGEGTQAPLADRLVADGLAERRPRLGRAEVARALDEATVLVLPSASEGLGRVVVEAFARGRGVVGSRVGAIPGLVEDGVSGLLVEPGDAPALAAAVERVLADRALAQRLGEGAHAAAPRWALTAEQHVERTQELVERVLR